MLIILMFLLILNYDLLFQKLNMRLKSGDGPLSVYNGNDPSIVNSPKRINTLHNSNITASITSNLTANSVNSNDLITTDTTNTNTLNNVNNEGTVQWCNSALTQERELTNNAKNRAQFNINNTLAASLREPRYGTASSICSESSPDDSLLEYEGKYLSLFYFKTFKLETQTSFEVKHLKPTFLKANLKLSSLLITNLMFFIAVLTKNIFIIN